MKLRLIALLLQFALGATSAGAQEHPVTRPTRDVDVTYDMTGPGGAEAGRLSQRVRWAAAGPRMRVDTPSPGLYVVMDYGAHLMSAIRPAEKMVLQIPSDGARLAPSAPAGDYVRQGERMVAGLPCTEWRTRDTSGATTEACLTADGVLLRARIGQTGVVEAVRVIYAPLPDAIFAVPADFRRVAPPGQRP